MTDEVLVSTVYFRGQSIGAAGITVQDTSAKPTFTFSSPNLSGNTFAVRMSQQITLNITETPYIPNYSTLYYRLTIRDAYMFRATSSETVIDGPNGIGRIVMQPNNGVGYGQLLIDMTFYPPMSITLARLEVYLDAELTDRIGLFNLECQAPREVALRLTSQRNMGNNPEAAPTGIYNNDKMAIMYSDENMNQNYMTNVPFTLYVADRLCPAGLYPLNTDNWISGSLSPIIPMGFQSAQPVLMDRQRNAYVRGNVSCNVVCGDYVNSNTCVDQNYFGTGTIKLVYGRGGVAVGAGVTNLDTGMTDPTNFGAGTLIQNFMDFAPWTVRLSGIQAYLSNATRRDSIFLYYLTEQGNANAEDNSSVKPDTVYLHIGGYKYQMNVNRRTNTNSERRIANQAYILANTGLHNQFNDVFRSLVNQVIDISITLS